MSFKTDIMILGIGTDLVKISRIENIYSKYQSQFLKKVFTSEEQIKFKSIKSLNGTKYLAKRFAAKEALVKAIGTGFNNKVNLQDISVNNDILGKPYYDINKKLDKYIKELFSVSNYSIHLSITDDKEYANAIALIEKIDL